MTVLHYLASITPIELQDDAAFFAESLQGHLRENLVGTILGRRIQDLRVEYGGYDPKGRILSIRLVLAGEVDRSTGPELDDRVHTELVDVLSRVGVRSAAVSLHRDVPMANGPLGPANDSVRLWIDPGDAPPEVIAEFLTALSNVHRAAGGSGLVFRVDGESVVAVERELV